MTGLSWIALALLGFEPAPTETTRSELALVWEAPADCPDAAGVRDRVAVLLGRPLDAPRGDTVRADATVRHVDGRYALTLRTTMGDAVQTRTFDGQTCGVLADAAALVLATALDPDAMLGGPEPGPEPDTDLDPPPDAEPQAEPEPRAEPEALPEPEPEPELATSPVGGAVRVAARGNVGLLPGPAAGLDAAVVLRTRWARAELSFGFVFPRRARSTLRPDAGGEIGMWTLGARGCGVPRASIVEFPVCAGLSAGPMHGIAFGVDTRTAATVPFVALDAGAAVAVAPWPFLAFWAGPDLVVPLTRPRFSIDNLGLVHRVAPVAGRLVLGVEVRFGGRAD